MCLSEKKRTVLTQFELPFDSFDLSVWYHPLLLTLQSFHERTGLLWQETRLYRFLLFVLKSSCRADAAFAWDASLIMGDVISSHLDEGKREIITGKERRGGISLMSAGLACFPFCHSVSVSPAPLCLLTKRAFYLLR